MTTQQPSAKPGVKQSSAETSAESLVSSFVTDTIMILAIALIVYIPAAQNRLATLRQRQAGTSGSANTLEPVRLDLVRGSILIADGGTDRPVTSLSAAERERFRGRAATIRVHGDSIAAAEMAALADLYHEAELASWSFEFTPSSTEATQ